MAAAVAAALRERHTLVVEAGTGTGKTFAYLVPALLSGQRILVSTGTRHLQDQLFHRDLPVVREALGLPVQVALLKGRANYLCQHRLSVTRAEGRLASREQIDQLAAIADWAGRTRSGDIAELSAIGEDAAIWPRVTSTADNCLGSDCDWFGECHVLKARREAQEAEVVVINHHLLFADMALKEEGFGELLPSVDALIIDEAHQLPATASQFFGSSLGSRQLQDLARDAVAEYVREAGSASGLPDTARSLDNAVQDVRLALGRGEQRAAWKQVAASRTLQAALRTLAEQLDALAAQLEAEASRSRGLDACWRRTLALREQLRLTTETPPADHVHWFETFRQSFRIQLTPLDIADLFRARRAALPDTWIYTSATLSVNGSFSHFAARLGLDEPVALQLDSPFDFSRNALLYLPDAMPDPNSGQYVQRVLEVAEGVIEAAAGRTFLLFTSYRALHEAARHLRGRCPYPLLVQGDAPRSELLERFRELGDAVLLGTSSFWEGVDVRGEALSCVLIDKLPFASPGDPVLQARIEALRERGGNPFVEEQLPHAVITLKQGVGRLIRDVDDRGVLVLCDPRLKRRSYGRVFLDSLPAMRQTRDLGDVWAFFDRRPAARARS
ncbi:MAG TPA: ATP-dependent DNA helicase [Gammaproteobacteria bacterium]|nr:ATP-dependent DNA helicase [Gammaproteobacteria bacterium]